MSTRLSLSDAYRDLFALLSKPHAARASVTLKTNAKGETQVEVTVPAESVSEAGELCQAEYDRLCEVYRLESYATAHEPGNGGTPFD